MGLIKKFIITKEPDMKRTVKKIVTVKAPCANEMSSLMECFRKYASGQADSACAQERQALALCAKASGSVRQSQPNVSQTKSKFYSELERLGTALRRSGF